MLGGSGFSWQDEQVYELRAGDCVVHLADHEEHTLRGGPDGLEVLICGTRHPTELGWLPRSKAIRLGWPWVEGRTDDPWDIEAAGGAARVRRSRAAAEEHRQRRRSRGRRRGRRATAPASNALSGESPGLCGPGCGTRSSPTGKLELPAALPRLRRGVLRRPRRRGHLSTRRRGAPAAARVDRGPSAGNGCRSRLPRAPDAPHVRDERAERDLLLPALEQDRLLRRRSHRPHREARLLGRRATFLTGTVPHRDCPSLDGRVEEG